MVLPFNLAAAGLAAVPAGPYINAWKVLPLLIFLLAWAKLLTWIDKDAPDCHLPRVPINCGMFGAFVVAFLVFMLAPMGFGGAFGAYVGLMIVSIGAYLGIRGQKVGLSDLTGKFSAWASGLFSKKEKEVEAVAGQVLIINKAGTALEPPEADDPERKAYDSAQTLLTDPLRRNAERIELTSGAEGADISYVVDGMKYDAAGMDKSTASNAVSYLKQAAGMDINERRKPQKGSFKTVLDGAKYEIQINTAGSTAGESLSLLTNPKSRTSFKLENLGMPADQLELIRASIEDSKGVVLVSAPKGQGLTSLMYAILRGHDAFMYHIQTVERAPESDLEGITQSALAANAAGPEEAKQINWSVSQEPDVIALTSIEDPRSARDLAKYGMSGERRRAYIGLRAGSTFEALRQWRKLIADDTLAADSLNMIVSGRLIRKLCSACKVGYTPNPDLLRKLNMDSGKVGNLYQARTSPMRDAKGNPIPCTFCHDLAFTGRLGIYEILVVDKEIKDLIRNGGADFDQQLKVAFRKQRSRYLQEMALQLVEAGETSLNEVQRVLKGDTASGGGAAKPTARAPSKPRPQQ